MGSNIRATLTQDNLFVSRKTVKAEDTEMGKEEIKPLVLTGA